MIRHKGIIYKIKYDGSIFNYVNKLCFIAFFSKKYEIKVELPANVIAGYKIKKRFPLREILFIKIVTTTVKIERKYKVHTINFGNIFWLPRRIKNWLIHFLNLCSARNENSLEVGTSWHIPLDRSDYVNSARYTKSK